MNTYSDALDSFLKEAGNSELALAGTVGCTQAAINRYRNGRRFPDAERARQIDVATNGRVPFELWQGEFLSRSGLAPVAQVAA